MNASWPVNKVRTMGGQGRSRIPQPSHPAGPYVWTGGVSIKGRGRSSDRTPHDFMALTGQAIASIGWSLLLGHGADVQ